MHEVTFVQLKKCPNVPKPMLSHPIAMTPTSIPIDFNKLRYAPCTCTAASGLLSDTLSTVVALLHMESVSGVVSPFKIAHLQSRAATVA